MLFAPFALELKEVKPQLLNEWEKKMPRRGGNLLIDLASKNSLELYYVYTILCTWERLALPIPYSSSISCFAVLHNNYLLGPVHISRFGIAGRIAATLPEVPNCVAIAAQCATRVWGAIIFKFV